MRYLAGRGLIRFVFVVVVGLRDIDMGSDRAVGVGGGIVGGVVVVRVCVVVGVVDVTGGGVVVVEVVVCYVIRNFVGGVNGCLCGCVYGCVCTD